MACLGEQNGKDRFIFIWRIENFRYSSQVRGEYFESETFYVPALKNEFCLNLYPRGYEKHDNIVCRLLRNDGKDTSPVVFNCEVCLCNTNGERLWVYQKENISYAKGPEETKCIMLKAVTDLDFIYCFPRDTLVLHCHLWDNKSIPTETPMHCYSLTRISVHRKMFVWNIDRFTTLQLKDVRVFTLKPLKANCPTLTFKMSLAGLTVDNACLQIMLMLEGVNKESFFTCSISVAGPEGAKMKSMTVEQFSTFHVTLIFPNFVSRRELVTNRTTYLPSDVLTLECEVAISDDEHNIQQVVYGLSPLAAMDFFSERDHTLPEVAEQATPHTVREDLGFLQAGDRAFPVHRFILTDRSPILKKMWEKGSNTLSLPDLDPDTADRMLRYMYTDAMPDDLPWQDAAQLYYAAEKYQLADLKRRCWALLGEQVDASNAAKLLVLPNGNKENQDPPSNGAPQIP